MDKFGYKINNWSKVYFVQGDKGGPIKIGYTDNVEQRMKLMQTGNPEKLILLHLTRGGKILEEQLHIRFSSYHYRGEWFEPAKEILDYIDELKERDNAEPPLLTIVELSLAMGEFLTNDDKKLLQEMVNGAILNKQFNWDRHEALFEQYQEYLKDPKGFRLKYGRHMKF